MGILGGMDWVAELPNYFVNHRRSWKSRTKSELPMGRVAGHSAWTFSTTTRESSEKSTAAIKWEIVPSCITSAKAGELTTMSFRQASSRNPEMKHRTAV